MDIDNGDIISSSGKGTFSLYYRKIDNSGFFSSLEESELEIKNSKNYVPIYENYFNFNDTNCNSINLNQRYYVSALSGIVDKNNIQAAVIDSFKSVPESTMVVHKPIFIKFSPLIDPIKYMTGKYDNLASEITRGSLNSEVLNLPTFSKLEQTQGIFKANDRNNSAYVDGFFSYLSSQLLSHHDFINGLDFYGFFNATKTNFHYNVIDDIDYLEKNQYFNKYRNLLFNVEDIDDYSIDSDGKGGDGTGNKNGTRNMKHKIKIEHNANNDDEGCDGAQYVIPDDFESVCKELHCVFSVTPSQAIACASATTSDTSDTSIELGSCIGDINSIELPPPCDGSIGIGIGNVNINNTNAINNIGQDNNGQDSNGNIEEFHINKDDANSSDSETESCSSRSSYTDDDDEDGDGDDGGPRRAVGSNSKIINDVYENEIDIDSGSGSNSGGGSDGDDSIPGGSGSEGEGSEYDSECDDDDDDTLWATIHNFPVSAIMLEKCDDTLDSLMMQEEDMKDGEWKSALFQIIMTLITYQKAFGFTHNDLHTNNVMFIYTEKEYIYYLYDKKYYRVPTYNRIFKIIDFGRAIYRYKSKVICSDSFCMTGDAATQYNCEPYLNDKKPRLDPNYSFDLCRLGCSIFDYFVDNIGDVAKICKANPIAKLIVEWVTDDQNRNILYKTNGEERYPDFKLYKMIARNVHNHTPHSQLSKPMFAAYEFPKKQVKQKHKIINIDKIPSYMV
jgi:hypothetical protein